jgi:RimJ/RimL family protein N-acetyltransferase
VCLDVFAVNEPAIGLYKKLGFIEEGRRIRDIQRGADDYVDTVMMYRFVKQQSERVPYNDNEQYRSG